MYAICHLCSHESLEPSASSSRRFCFLPERLCHCRHSRLRNGSGKAIHLTEHSRSAHILFARHRRVFLRDGNFSADQSPLVTIPSGPHPQPLVVPPAAARSVQRHCRCSRTRAGAAAPSPAALHVTSQLHKIQRPRRGNISPLRSSIGLEFCVRRPVVC